MATRTEIQYRVTKLETPLRYDTEFDLPAPKGDGWKPESIAGNETVFYALWSRLVEIETDEDGKDIRTTSLLKGACGI